MGIAAREQNKLNKANAVRVKKLISLYPWVMETINTQTREEFKRLSIKADRNNLDFVEQTTFNRYSQEIIAMYASHAQTLQMINDKVGKKFLTATEQVTFKNLTNDYFNQVINLQGGMMLQKLITKIANEIKAKSDQKETLAHQIKRYDYFNVLSIIKRHYQVLYYLCQRSGQAKISKYFNKEVADLTIAQKADLFYFMEQLKKTLTSINDRVKMLFDEETKDAIESYALSTGTFTPQGYDRFLTMGQRFISESAANSSHIPSNNVALAFLKDFFKINDLFDDN